MRIAVAESFVSADIGENGKTIRRLIRDAAATDVRLILFCEGALSGYSKSQIISPLDWKEFNWAKLEVELELISAVCRDCGIHAVIGSAHLVAAKKHPHNSLYILSDTGDIITRYDKRFLSNTEVTGWYTPGLKPVIFEACGFRFGCSICIEACFPEVFSEYERLGVDVVLHASYGIPPQHKLALQAHGYINCIWIVAATPAQVAHKGCSFISDPECTIISEKSGELTVAKLDRNDTIYETALSKARPWRKKARQGDIYRRKIKVQSDYPS